MAARTLPLGGVGQARMRRRRMVNLVGIGFLSLVVLAVLSILFWILYYVTKQGAHAFSITFLTHTPPSFPGAAGGGFENGIVGSFIIVGLATAIAVPIGILAAIYLSEYGRGRAAYLVRFLADVMTGIPTIVIGAFVYTIIVIRWGFSGYAGAVSLALVMLPLVIRATEEMLRLVPSELREASLALGVGKARTTLAIVLPAALSGIITGVMLAVARAMGETAPLLLTALGNDLFMETNPAHRMSALSLQIFDSAIAGYSEGKARAWAGALTLVGIVLILTIIARFLGRRRAELLTG
jgi:phosphate transport system permease protein